MSLIAPVGAGGQGAVFRGTCKGAPAAIKAYTASTDTRRIDRECKLLSGLSCPHVVRILEHFPAKIGSDDVRIVVYEYHDGGDLSALSRPESAVLSEAELVTIGSQIGTGIATLWSNRIVHRDIKPPNIVRASDGRYLLVDVGFARHIDLSDITAAGGAPGTRGYRSPEQAKGRRSLTVNSDVYSLGVTLYVLATKRHPFGGRDLIAPESINVAPITAAGFSGGFARLVGQMLAFAPASRPSDLVARFAALGAP